MNLKATVTLQDLDGVNLKTPLEIDGKVSFEPENGAWKIEDEHGSLVYLPKAERFTGKRKKRLEVLHNL